MSYALYGARGSGSSIVEAVLAELRVAYEFRTLDMKNNAHREAEFSAINPHRKIPTLITPKGETLTESAAIVLTLTDRHPEAGLLRPPGSPERAIALRWLLFAASELYPVVEILDYPERFAADEAAASCVRAAAHETWRARWRTVEQSLGPGPYLLGEQFCATDIYLAVLSRWDMPAPWREANIPRVDELARTVGQRPRLREIWARNFPATSS